jgi:hypothetical protein
VVGCGIPYLLEAVIWLAVIYECMGRLPGDAALLYRRAGLAAVLRRTSAAHAAAANYLFFSVRVMSRQALSSYRNSADCAGEIELSRNTAKTCQVSL